jgi:hypothetical protein
MLSLWTIVLSSVFVVSTVIAYADPAVQRIFPPTLQFNEGMGVFTHATAIGGGRIAVGSTAAKNSLGIDSGAVHLFDEKTGKFLFSIFPADGASGDRFGMSVAISAGRIAIGAPRNDSNGPDAGACYVFDLKTKRLVHKVAGPFLAGEEGGAAVALEGDLLAVAAPRGNFGGGGASSGFVAVINLLNPLTTAFATNPTPVAGDSFGFSIALHGKLLAVGIPGDDTAAPNAGAVQLFDIGTTDFISQLVDAAPFADDGLGWDVDLDRSILAASGPFSNDGGAGLGKVTTWSISRPEAPFALGRVTGTLPFRRFGDAVSVEDGLVAVSESLRISDVHPFSAQTGAVDFYDRNQNLLQTVQPPSLPEGGGFGTSICLVGRTLVSAAPFDSAGTANGGSLWKVSPILPPRSSLITRVVATSGEPAPAGGSFTRFQLAAGTGGDPVLVAGLSAAGTSPGMNAGAWAQRGVSSYFDRISLAGNPPGGVRILRYTDLVAHSNEFFVKTLRTGPGVTSANAEGWRFFGVGIEGTVLQGGDALPLGTVKKVGLLRQDSTLTTAMVAHTLVAGTGAPAVTAASDTAISVLNGVSISGVVREGINVSALGTPYGQMPTVPTIAGAKGTGVFLAQPGGGVTTDNNLYVDNNGVSVVARKSDIAPAADGSPLFPWRGFTATVRSSLAVSFLGTMNTATNAEGLWSNRTGSVRLVLRKGDSAPGIGGGVTIRRVQRLAMDESGTILALVQLQGSGVRSTNDLALYACLATLAEPGTIELLLREGDRLPGGARVGTISGLDLRCSTGFVNSFYGVLVTLVTESGVVTSADNLAWLVGSLSNTAGTSAALRQPLVVLRKGTTYADSPGRDRITSITMPTRTVEASGAFNTGLSHVIGPFFGRSTLQVTFADRKQAVVVID